MSNRWNIDRKIHVSLGLIKKAAEDVDFCEALALTLMVKAAYVSSTINDVTLDKIQKISHAGFGKARQAYQKAKKLELISEITRIGKDGKEHKDAIAGKLSCPGCTAATFSIRYANGTIPYIFLQTHDYNVDDRERRKLKYQKLTQVQKLIWLTKICCSLTGWRKSYDALLTEKVKSYRMKERSNMSYFAWRKFAQPFEKQEPGVVNALNGGFSYEAMKEIFYDNLSINQIRSIIQLGVDEGVIYKESNYLRVRELPDYQDMEIGTKFKKPKSAKDYFAQQAEWSKYSLRARAEDWVDRDDCGVIIRDYHKRGFERKIDGKDWLYTRTANSYFIYAKIFSKRVKNYKPRTIKKVKGAA